MAIDPKILTGQTDTHVEALEGGRIRLHEEVLGPFREMKKAAAAAGFDLQIISGFRDFNTQLRIWNEKATGKRPLLDKDSKPLAFAKLRPEEVLENILYWSSIPGASRHHWGTDFDVYDAKKVPKDYKIQLVPSEYEAGGIFSAMSGWLDEEMREFGFFRPYGEDLGGVSPERWHLSFAEISTSFLEALDIDLVKKTIQTSNIELKRFILDDLTKIYHRYITNVSTVY